MLLLAPLAGWRAAAQPPAEDESTELGHLIAAEWGAGDEAVAQLKRFYVLLDRYPAWTGRELALHQALAAGAAHGLEPGAYSVEQAELALRLPAGLSAASRRDLATSATALRFIADLHSGRLAPDQVGASWDIDAAHFDAAAALADALRAGDLVQWIAALAPPQPGYARLLGALEQHRAIAARGGWTEIDIAGGTLDAGDPRMASLRQRLVLGGELADDKAQDDAELVAALRRFQARHGLAVDGRAGAKTLAELNVPVAQRIEQIVANLERWRWLPRLLPDHHVAVNIADQTVELVENGATALRLRTVVGTPKNPTPVLQARITGVTFNPAWNIPHSIARKEILPTLRRNPGHLRDNDMVIRNALPDDPHGLGVNWRGVPAGRFPYLLRQRPGPKNALGQIKLELPNRYDVYLHDTPSKALFARAERYFSHGCIRVQDVRVLADRLLAATGATVNGNALAAAERGETVTVPLPRAVPIYLLYFTVFVDADGTVQFRRDAYGRDRRITVALADQAAARAGQPAPAAQPEAGGAGL